MTKILITGHEGFVGSNLVSILDPKKYQITGLSRILQKDANIVQIKKDILRINDSDAAKNSIIIHLAAITDIKYCEQHPVECFKVNALGTQNLLELARKKDCSFIYISTSHVYGKPKKLPINEDHPQNATSIYATSKIAGELCCESYSKSYGMDISILRLFSVYGPRSPGHLVTSKIISQMLSGKSIKLGNLYPKRDFVYITDAVKAIEISLKKLDGFNIYNVGIGKSHSILEICNILKKLTRNTAPVISTKTYSRKDEINNMVSNPSKIKKLGWKPSISLQKGLEMTLKWYKNKYHLS